MFYYRDALLRLAQHKLAQHDNSTKAIILKKHLKQKRFEQLSKPF